MTRRDMFSGSFRSRERLRPASFTLCEKKPEPSLPSTLSVADVEAYADSYIKFSSANPTTFHVVAYFADQLESHGFVKLSERQNWLDQLDGGGKYFVERNGTNLIAFVVGQNYDPGNGAAIIASHVDALATRLKPVSKVPNKAGYVQLGVAPYAGGLGDTWWDRDLGIGGRVLVQDKKTGRIESKLVKLEHPIARVPTLAPHFGAVSDIHGANKETRRVPIIGLDNSDLDEKPKQTEERLSSPKTGAKDSFASTQPPRLLKAIAKELGIEDLSTIANWELELFDTQPAQLGGLDKEFIFAGRLDDRLCSFAAIEALLASSESSGHEFPGEESTILKIVGLYDDEEIGSQTRQGARGTLLPTTISRIVQAFSRSGFADADALARTYANSFLISADVGHAVNPNYLDAYLDNHSPRLNVGVAVQADPNGNSTTDSVSTALLQQVADKVGSKLQVFQIRNDSRSGSTVGPYISTALGVRAIDAGISQLSMHSIRATTGNLDPGLGVKLYKGFFDHFEEVDKAFE